MAACAPDLPDAAGLAVDELDTPALLVDLDALERNLATMARFFAGRPAHLRPHVKTHKCPEIARRQLAAGARGITCAKLSEAEVFAAAGLDDILIANQIVGPAKIARLMALARRARVTVAVDDATNVAALSQAAQREGLRLPVLVEVDIGMGRCGVAPGEPALALARKVADAPGLELAGLMGYEGHLVLVRDPAERKARVEAALAPLIGTKELLERQGLPVPVVSGGGTGTYDVTGAYPGVTEVQAGSYVFMDATYRPVRPEFEPSLFVLATVISRPDPGRLVVDAGLKATTGEFGPPQVVGFEGVESVRLSEEHGRITLTEGHATTLRPGDRVRLIPSHCCTTVNLHDRLYATRSGVVEGVWPIAARGCSW